MLNPKKLLYTHGSAADAAIVNPNGIKTLLKSLSVFSNSPRSLSKNRPGCTNLDS